MVKLPKLDVPTFNGNILQWLTFWEQFSVAIHDRVDLTKPQKMAYLRQALKHGSARNMIEGLSRTGEQYDEAIECLENRYNKPRLIHQAHVKEIIEVPNLRDNSAKEIRRLHDVLQQHLRALKAMRTEPSSPFITSLIEMKTKGLNGRNIAKALMTCLTTMTFSHSSIFELKQPNLP